MLKRYLTFAISILLFEGWGGHSNHTHPFYVPLWKLKPGWLASLLRLFVMVWRGTGTGWSYSLFATWIVVCDDGERCNKLSIVVAECCLYNILPHIYLFFSYSGMTWILRFVSYLLEFFFGLCSSMCTFHPKFSMRTYRWLWVIWISYKFLWSCNTVEMREDDIIFGFNY